MEGEPVLKKASITQRQLGLHCVGLFHCLGIDWTVENQLYYEASDRAPARRNQAASPLSGVGWLVFFFSEEEKFSHFFRPIGATVDLEKWWKNKPWLAIWNVDTAENGPKVHVWSTGLLVLLILSPGPQLFCGFSPTWSDLSTAVLTSCSKDATGEYDLWPKKAVRSLLATHLDCS